MKKCLLTAAAVTAILAAIPAQAVETAASTENGQVVKKVTTTTTTTAEGVTTTVTSEETSCEVSASGTSAPKISVVPVGRILMDGAMYTSDEKDLFPDGVAIPELRLGAKATYGKWMARAEIGYAYGKVSLKDIYFNYDINAHNSLRFGYFIYQFGLQSATGASMKISMFEPMVNEALNNPRLLGMQYIYDKDSYFAAASVYAESGAMRFNTTEMRKTGYGAMTRLAWRPLRGVSEHGGNVFQPGISFQVSSPQFNGNPDSPDNHVYSLSANFPTQVARVKAVGAEVTDVDCMFRFTPELLLARGPVALETQYYYMQLTRRHDQPTYKAYGAYGMLRCLALGGDYGYASYDCALANPRPKSLEFVLGYTYLNTSSDEARIYGGRAQDYSLTANWYINKYMIWRLRASYTHSYDRMGTPDVNLGALQTRFQVIF